MDFYGADAILINNINDFTFACIIQVPSSLKVNSACAINTDVRPEKVSSMLQCFTSQWHKGIFTFISEEYFPRKY
jgi:hypothetical protein